MKVWFKSYLMGEYLRRTTKLFKPKHLSRARCTPVLQNYDLQPANHAREAKSVLWNNKRSDLNHNGDAEGHGRVVKPHFLKSNFGWWSRCAATCLWWEISPPWTPLSEGLNSCYSLLLSFSCGISAQGHSYKQQQGFYGQTSRRSPLSSC